MVNPNSQAFKLFEKVGLLIGKGIRYIIVGGVIIFLARKFGGPNPPAR
jgi:hypothetical protein